MNTLEIIQEVFGNNEVSEAWLQKQFEFAYKVHELGVQEGMKREHAMWVLAKIGQDIEEKDEYCPHGIRHERYCKSCECIEQADMRSEM